jgi:hypothetical protein
MKGFKAANTWSLVSTPPYAMYRILAAGIAAKERRESD